MKRSLCIVLAASLLAGCGYNRPDLTSENVLPIDALVSAIQCEFEDAVRTQIFVDGRTWLNTWQGAYTITLKGNESTVLKAANTFPFNIGKGSLLNLGVGGGTTSTANRTAILKFNLNFADVKEGPACAYGPPTAVHPFLRGRIGFAEWMDRAISDADKDPVIAADHKKMSGLGHTFEFSVDLNGNVAPGFSIMPAPVVTLAPSATVDRLEDNSVDVTMAPAAAVSKSASVTTVAFSKAQQKQLADLTAALNKLAAKIDELSRKLNRPENKDLLAKQAELSLLSDNLRVAQSMGLKIESDDKLKANFSRQNELIRNVAPQAAKIVELQQNKAELAQAISMHAQLYERYTQLSTHPALSRTVESQTFQRNVSVPADQNANVIAIQQQLVLERTLGNIRTTIP